MFSYKNTFALGIVLLSSTQLSAMDWFKSQVSKFTTPNSTSPSSFTPLEGHTYTWREPYMPKPWTTRASESIATLGLQNLLKWDNPRKDHPCIIQGVQNLATDAAIVTAGFSALVGIKHGIAQLSPNSQDMLANAATGLINPIKEILPESLQLKEFAAKYGTTLTHSLIKTLGVARILSDFGAVSWTGQYDNLTNGLASFQRNHPWGWAALKNGALLGLFGFAWSKTSPEARHWAFKDKNVTTCLNSIISTMALNAVCGNSLWTKASDEPNKNLEEFTVPPAVKKINDCAGGLNAMPLEIQDIVRRFKTPGAFKTAPVGGILLYGPSRTGKTHLMECIAGELGYNFKNISCNTFLSKYKNESAIKVHEIFEKAIQEADNAPMTILFFDEADQIGIAQDTQNDPQGTVQDDARLVSAFLTKIPQAIATKKIIVIFATNNKDRIDKRLLKRGRIGEHIFMDLPDQEKRASIIKHALGNDLKNFPTAAEIHDAFIAQLTADADNLNNADLIEIVKEAQRIAERKERGYLTAYDLRSAYARLTNNAEPDLA